jgi:hypothetical protein
MKKKWIVLISVLLIVFSDILWLSMRPEPPIEVYGNLSTKEIVQIKSATRREMRHDLFPDFSWLSVKGLPGAIMEFSRRRILAIELGPNGKVIVVSQRAKEGATINEELYLVTSNQNGWHVTGGPVWDLPRNYRRE